MVQKILIDTWITRQAGAWGVYPPYKLKKYHFFNKPLYPKNIFRPISRTPIVYKNQVSGHGFWTKFFMVFSYTVFLNNMFLRYRGVLIWSLNGTH
jgi:hypothetical protein